MKKFKNKENFIGKTVGFFLTTTTLHGFKYFHGNKLLDRLGWFCCCCASAACAVILCTVMLARFLENPSVLTVQPQTSHNLPVLAICLPAYAVARTVIDQLAPNSTEAEVLAFTLTRILRQRRAGTKYLHTLDRMLYNTDTDLNSALVQHAPPCTDIVKRCRILGNIKCETLFQNEMTDIGVCCVFDVERNKKNNNIKGVVKELSVVLNCSSNTYHNNNCRVFTHFKGEAIILPKDVMKGYEYFISIELRTLQDGKVARVVGVKCMSENGYFRRKCLLECRERICGCSEPLRSMEDGPHIFPYCSPLRLNCLRDIRFQSDSYKGPGCSCPPACEKISIENELKDAAAITANKYNIDPMYSGLDVNQMVVLHIKVLRNNPHTFKRTTTETWSTLMSSLGGIFSMFLGVGLFSILEFLFFILFRLPKAIFKKVHIVQSYHFTEFE